MDKGKVVEISMEEIKQLEYLNKFNIEFNDCLRKIGEIVKDTEKWVIGDLEKWAKENKKTKLLIIPARVAKLEPTIKIKGAENERGK